MNTKTDFHYIKKTLENINVIITYTKNLTYKEFIENDLVIDATMFRLVQMAENINRISQNFKNQSKDVKWGSICGFRNGIVHNYGKTDYTIVYEIISNDIYELKEKLEQFLDENLRAS